MPGAVAKVKEKTFTRVKFVTEFHELELIDVGAGVAVMVPEWDRMALVLTKADVQQAKAIFDAVLARP